MTETVTYKHDINCQMSLVKFLPVRWKDVHNGMFTFLYNKCNSWNYK